MLTASKSFGEANTACVGLGIHGCRAELLLPQKVPEVAEIISNVRGDREASGCFTTGLVDWHDVFFVIVNSLFGETSNCCPQRCGIQYIQPRLTLGDV